MCRRLEMPPSVCRGCANRLSSTSDGVDIFSKETSSSFSKENNIRTWIELITGLTVSDTDGLPGRLCVECNNKLEEFLAFRNQLLTSHKVFLSSGYSSKRSEQQLEARSEVIGSLPSPVIITQNNSIDRDVPELKQEETILLELSDQEKSSIRYEKLDKIDVIDEDVESDIDVCSGEDYDVLELDVQCKKDEIYEIESSGESDIQVCDYEPNLL